MPAGLRWGYDGLEIACWGDHLDVERAANDDSYVQERLDLLKRHNLQLFAISNHLNGQAVCDDPIDERHKGIVHPRVWGDGDPEGVRQRAAEEMKLTARAARKLGVDVVVGFTGSKIWKTVAMFPPASESMIEDGYADFAARWNPILDVFDEVGVKFAHEVHPSEIAYDYWTTVRTMEAIGHREASVVPHVKMPATSARCLSRNAPEAGQLMPRSVAALGVGERLVDGGRQGRRIRAFFAVISARRRHRQSTPYAPRVHGDADILT